MRGLGSASLKGGGWGGTSLKGGGWGGISQKEGGCGGASLKGGGWGAHCTPNLLRFIPIHRVIRVLHEVVESQPFVNFEHGQSGA